MAEKIVVANQTWEENCRELEKGNILFFQDIPFPFPQEEIDFLLKQRQKNSSGRKNIAYKPQIDRITNHDTKDSAAAEQLLHILRHYSQSVTTFLSHFLSPYAKAWKHDYASFRPFQEQGRQLRLRARNDLLHVDAFPTRPMHGARILRFFTNINPIEARQWITAEPFGLLATKYGGVKKLPFPKPMDYSLKNRLARKMKKILHQSGIKIALKSPYDQFMLKMHHFLKENREFQQNCHKDFWSFPPRSCWLVFTDLVSHAALSGQYALEQTFLIPEKALLYPELSPVSILERLTGENMVDLNYSEAMFS